MVGLAEIWGFSRKIIYKEIFCVKIMDKQRINSGFLWKPERHGE